MIKNIDSLPDRIGEFIQGVIDSIIELPEKVGEFIKNLFVPSDGYIEKKIEEIKTKFLGLGSQSYDMTKIFNKKQPFEDIKCMILGQEVTIVDFDAVDTVIDHFRPIIQGFMYLMLIFYNVNQFLGFIGQEGVAVGSIFTNTIYKGGGKE